MGGRNFKVTFLLSKGALGACAQNERATSLLQTLGGGSFSQCPSVPTAMRIELKKFIVLNFCKKYNKSSVHFITKNIFITRDISFTFAERLMHKYTANSNPC